MEEIVEVRTKIAEVTPFPEWSSARFEVGSYQRIASAMPRGTRYRAFRWALSASALQLEEKSERARAALKGILNKQLSASPEAMP